MKNGFPVTVEIEMEKDGGWGRGGDETEAGEEIIEWELVETEMEKKRREDLLISVLLIELVGF